MFGGREETQYCQLPSWPGGSFVVFWFLVLGAGKLAKSGHTSARNTSHVPSCEGPCLFFGKHEDMWKKREKSPGQLSSVV